MERVLESDDDGDAVVCDSNCPHPNQIMTDFFRYTMVPTIPLLPTPIVLLSSGSFSPCRMVEGSATAKDEISTRGSIGTTLSLETAEVSVIDFKIVKDYLGSSADNRLL